MLYQVEGLMIEAFRVGLRLSWSWAQPKGAQPKASCSPSTDSKRKGGDHSGREKGRLWLRLHRKDGVQERHGQSKEEGQKKPVG